MVQMLHVLASRAGQRYTSALVRSMSSKAYVVPLDPNNPGQNAASNVNPASLWATLPPTQKPAKVGTSHLFYGASGGTDVTALVSLGDAFEAKKGDARREIVRKAVGSGVKGIKALGEGISEAFIDASTDPHAAGEILDTSYIAFHSMPNSCRCPLGTVRLYFEDVTTLCF